VPETPIRAIAHSFVVVGIVSLLVGLVVWNGPATASTTTTTLPASSTTLAPSTTTTLPTTTTTKPVVTQLAWPSEGSAAVAIPQLSVAASSPRQPRQPIASLTKMMTAWVTLHRLPITYSQRGPCEVVNNYDMAQYNYDVAIGLSSVEIVKGMNICEGTLLRGLLVHSAADYAELLVRLTGLGEVRFVNQMNVAAHKLGLYQTHYDDVSGLSNGDTSTAANQATMAIDLMNAEPVVRDIVRLPRVRLPVVGVVDSYTSFVGDGGVIGVKSGFTTPAGGCDIMATQFVLEGTTYVSYAVVLGEHGANPLQMVGRAVLHLARSLRSLVARVRTSHGIEVEWIGPSSDVVSLPTTTTTTTTTTSTTTNPTTTSTTTTVP